MGNIDNIRHFSIDLVLKYFNLKIRKQILLKIKNGLKSQPGLITLFETACFAEIDPESSSPFTDDAKI
jgi:hypothetical protein